MADIALIESERLVRVFEYQHSPLSQSNLTARFDAYDRLGIQHDWLIDHNYFSQRGLEAAWVKRNINYHQDLGYYLLTFDAGERVIRSFSQLAMIYDPSKGIMDLQVWTSEDLLLRFPHSSSPKRQVGYPVYSSRIYSSHPNPLTLIRKQAHNQPRLARLYQHGFRLDQLSSRIFDRPLHFLLFQQPAWYLWAWTAWALDQAAGDIDEVAFFLDQAFDRGDLGDFHPLLADPSRRWQLFKGMGQIYQLYLAKDG
ncbi:competence protein CoiA family protein [Hutsoniella sourekii]